MGQSAPDRPSTRPSPSTHALLNQLERLRSTFGPAIVAQRFSLLRQLSRRPILSASELMRYHDLLCVVRAYPDNRL